MEPVSFTLHGARALQLHAARVLRFNGACVLRFNGAPCASTSFSPCPLRSMQPVRSSSMQPVSFTSNSAEISCCVEVWPPYSYTLFPSSMDVPSSRLRLTGRSGRSRNSAKPRLRSANWARAYPRVTYPSIQAQSVNGGRPGRRGIKGPYGKRGAGFRRLFFQRAPIFRAMAEPCARYAGICVQSGLVHI